MILITGAAGKTGRAVIEALAGHGEPVRALVRREERRALVKRVGAAEAVAGDMRRPAVWSVAMAGIRAVYHICPNMSPDELAIGRLALAGAKAAGVTRFVYHSVLHPQVETMPHHWQKMRVEEAIFSAGLPFVILQPAAYMQNIQAYWPKAVESGVFRVPFPTTTRLSLVDLAEVAQVAAKVLVEEGHDQAIYELCGPAAPSQEEVAALFAQHLGRPVRAESLSLAEWGKQAERDGLGAYQIGSLCQMFDYYARYGFRGNPGVLGWLIGRPPADLSILVARWATAISPPSDEVF
jgi:NAD(P)H dehydrogenase (quinone)